MKNFIILSILFFLNTILYAKENIVVYTYHNHPPFITDNNKGLSYKLVNYLNQNSLDYNFILKVVPRSRLNYILKPWIKNNCNNDEGRCKSKWLVLWVNHKWGFGNNSLINFSWTPILKDSNIVVSSNTNKIEYKTPNTLINLTLAGISGHKYVGIDKLVEKNKIKRIDSNNELDNLFIVLSKKADVTIIPKSSFLYFQNLNKNLKSLYYSKTYHQTYMRNIMTNKNDSQLIDYLNSLKFDIFK